MIKELKELGLAGYEAKVYFALIKFGELSAKEISKKASIPQNRVYDTVRSLEEKGFIQVLTQKPALFRAIKPEAAFQHEIEKKKKTLNNFIKSIDKLKVITKVSEHLTSQKEKVWIVRGEKAYYNKIIELIKNAKKEILAKPGYFKSQMPMSKLSQEAMKRGIDVKIMFPITKDNIKRVENIYKLLKLNIRHCDLSDFLIDIFDKKIVFVGFYIGNDRIGITIESKEFANAMRNYYLDLWKNAMPFSKIIKKVYRKV